MNTIAVFLIALVAFEHVYFLILEMFLWTTPRGIKAFGLKSKAHAEDTKILAANQGLYNGFLAVGLLLSLFDSDLKMAVFLLICITVAGVYGAYTTKKIKLLYIQAVPAILALAAILI
ncbi:DUF1304 domain-containing protein [Aestuariivivens sediminicola]|uniref:DUF1304 domain-containing protein n=1 Tax=Aestuariivivens sediminicola TaxID=2913560 RepID=UPI001F56C2D9|nr:DUF1304 domain-containing protein [Aestuariivivens sediminicola]